MSGNMSKISQNVAKIWTKNWTVKKRTMNKMVTITWKNKILFYLEWKQMQTVKTWQKSKD